MLECVTGALGFALVVPGAPLGAVLAHDVRCDVDVVAAVFCASVMDRDPPAWRFSICPGKTHRVHEVCGDSSPDLVPEGSFFW